MLNLLPYLARIIYVLSANIWYSEPHFSNNSPNASTPIPQRISSTHFQPSTLSGRQIQQIIYHNPNIIPAHCFSSYKPGKPQQLYIPYQLNGKCPREARFNSRARVSLRALCCLPPNQTKAEHPFNDTPRRP